MGECQKAHRNDASKLLSKTVGEHNLKWNITALQMVSCLWQLLSWTRALQPLLLHFLAEHISFILLTIAAKTSQVKPHQPSFEKLHFEFKGLWARPDAQLQYLHNYRLLFPQHNLMVDFYDTSREKERWDHWTSLCTCIKCGIKVNCFLFATSVTWDFFSITRVWENKRWVNTSEIRLIWNTANEISS